MNNFKEILFRKKEIKNKVYNTVLILIPVFGIILKNVLLQAYLLGENLYAPDFVEAIKCTAKFWILYGAIVIAIMSVCLLFKKDENRNRYVFVWDIFFTILILMDLVYCRSFFTMPSMADVYIFKNFSGFEGGEVSSLLCGYDILIFVDIIVLMLFTLKFKRRQVDEDYKKRLLVKSGIVAFAVSVAIIVAVPLSSKLLNFEDSSYYKLIKSSDAREQAQFLSSMGFHVKDIYELLMENVETEEDIDEQSKIDDYYNWKNENLPDNKYAGMFEGKNVLFLQIESLESFVINQSIDGQEITPNINKIANSGFIFNNIVEQVQGGNSSDADLMYTTSRLPVLKGSTFFRFSDVSLNSLPRMLQDRGYSMTYHQAIDGGFWNYENAWCNMIGVDAFVGAESYDMSGYKIGFTMNDKDFLRQVTPYVEGISEPYYAHVVCNSSHMPFAIEEKDKELKLDKELDESYLGGYLQLCRYVDTQLGVFLSKLEEAGKLENTVIVVIGDHTGINKYYEYSVEEWHDDYPWTDINEMYTVPLIISDGSMKESIKSDVIGGQIDVMPTLSYLMGIKDDEYMNDAMGRILLKTERSYAIFRDGTIYGELTEEEKALVEDSYNISNQLFLMGK